MPATVATEAESDILLQTDGITKRFGDFTAIDGADSARSGELHCLSGTTDAGKLTLMKTFVGLLESEAGFIRYDSRNITDQSAHKYAEIAIDHAPLRCGHPADLTVRSEPDRRRIQEQAEEETLYTWCMTISSP